VVVVAVKREDDDQLLTAGDVAREFRVDPKTVGRWAVARRIKSFKTPGGHRRYRRGDVRAVLEADETTGDRYLLWSQERGMWWRPAASGYTTQRALAGLYTTDETVRHVLRSARKSDPTKVTVPILAPLDESVPSIDQSDDEVA